jgi:DNA-binding NarL/FixJ family response regulator
MPVKVVIADDHDLTVRGMVEMLQAHGGFEIVATANNGMDAIVAAKVHQPDIILLDMSMPDATGLEVYAEVRRWSPDTRAAIITGSATPALFAQLQGSGIEGMFLKNAPAQEICAGIVRVAMGERVVSDAVQTAIDAAGQREALSTRELEVLQSVANGLTNAKIAERLSISPKTVDNHRTNLMRKLGVNSSASLIVEAVKSGLIDV